MAEITPGAIGFDKYIAYFYDDKKPSGPDKARVAHGYYDLIEDEAWDKFRVLDGKPTSVDTGLEWLLTTYYSQAVVKARPVEAAKLLPANSRESEVKLAAATYAELQEIRFLDPQNSGRIGRYEGMLKFITDKQKITQAEISASLRASIHAVVDAEFNRVDFFISNILDSSANSYNGILTCNPQNGHYILSYEDAKYVTKELTAPTLEALSLKMRNSGDFVPAAIDTVRAQAALIPAVARPVELDRAKNTITNFYITPSTNTYNALVSHYRYYSKTNIDERNASYAFLTSLEALNVELAKRVAGVN